MSGKTFDKFGKATGLNPKRFMLKKMQKIVLVE